MFRAVIVGRPNVGKSALLNRLAKRTVSIVHDMPGVTRDRISATVKRDGVTMELVDTGGIGIFEAKNTPQEIAEAVEMQVQVAVDSAHVILLTVDGKEGVRPLDADIVKRLRKSGRKIWLVVNKLDDPGHDIRVAEFHQWGMDPVYPVSAAHGRGLDALWDALLKECRVTMEKEGASSVEEFSLEQLPRIAIVGRPNVGKSSLVNRLLGMERVIVSEIPGTTRDSVEMDVKVGNRRYILVDTAGIRQKGRIRSSVEMYSRHWTRKAIQGCDIALLVLSTPEGVTRQDKEISSMIGEFQKPCIILVNKWDLNEEIREEFPDGVRRKKVKRRLVSRSEYEKNLRYEMPFLDHAAVMFVSALQGYHAQVIWKEVEHVRRDARVEFPTGQLNRLISRAAERVGPPMTDGKRLKIFYVTQKVDAPVPTFLLFVNQAKLWKDSYGRYLTNRLRESHPMSGCPVIFQLRERQGDDPTFEKKEGREGSRHSSRKGGKTVPTHRRP